MKTDTQFLIVGLGLMGGSYAMGLGKKGYSVNAIDNNPASISFALKQGLIKQGSHQWEDYPALIQAADCIVIALYPHDIVPWIKSYQSYFKAGAILTDLAGVKRCFVSDAQNLLGEKHEFIPCHPMAGREVSGVENADDAIFKAANFIITPTDKNTQQGIDFAKSLAQTLGFSQITVLSVEEHDNVVGYVSQLTHAIAVSLMNANNNPTLPQVTGDSFRDLTRIADINPGLWSELFLSNTEALIEEIDVFSASLEQLRECLVQKDKNGLVEIFERSSQRRRQFNKQNLL